MGVRSSTSPRSSLARSRATAQLFAFGAARITLRQNRMAHASELLEQIARSGLGYVEVPVTIEYSAYSLAKGQTLGDTLMILVDLFARRLHR